MKTERLQVLIESDQRERLERVAAARGVSLGALVRDAIEIVYPAGSDVRARRAAAILAAAPMEVPDPTPLRAELDALRGRRG
ncbi:MAG: hypothetical protein LBG60_04520 [Bifidobacteriaceae bacterium]|nr:hypothetical protein [Bifidobacteriaceae bacterium]